MCHCISSSCFAVVLGNEYSECSDSTLSLMTDQSRIYSAVCLTRAQFQFVGMFVMLSVVGALKEREVDHLEMCTISLQSVIEGISEGPKHIACHFCTLMLYLYSSFLRTDLVQQ